MIQEESMQPLLYPGNLVLVNRLRKGKTGDVIVFENPKKDSSQMYLIKQIVKEENNRVYVLGLSKIKSIDSRHFGWIDKKSIIGKMIAKL